MPAEFRIADVGVGNCWSVPDTSMSLAPRSYIPLDRRFERSDTSHSAHYWAEILADRERPRDWNWLRERSRVVALLAQAGSGKTVEFMRQVDEARLAGREAFFFRVEHLCNGSLDGAYETPDCRSRFDEWIKGKQPADFFLDAVDEAKLPQARTARPLRDALRTLNAALKPHHGRISVIVSCRSSEWLDDIEQKALEDLTIELGIARGETEPASVFNATFANLNLDQIKRLAKGRGGDEAVVALQESEAIADIVTPLDAILYLDTYLEFKGTPDLLAQFASRGKLLETSVRRRLIEEGGEARRSQVEFTAALKAAKFLAFASVVAQTTDISVGAARAGCVDPQEILASGHAALSPDGIRQFLACPLFVPSGQARVRFYRREARDMLAAQWLRDRIDEGASPRTVTDKFIKTAFGKPRVPLIYGSMLSWLASYDPDTLRRMIHAAPEWIIEGGDPRTLALKDREAALEQHFALGPRRFSGQFMFEVGELRHFARPELEDAIVGRLDQLPPGDLFDDLMKFVEAGRYRSAAPYLIALLKDFSCNAGDRMFAVRSLIACGDGKDIADVARHFAQTGGPVIRESETFARGRNDHFLLDLVMAAYPHSISADETLALLSQLHGKDYSHEAKSLARWLADCAPVSDIPKLLVGLDALCFDLTAKAYKPFSYEMPGLHPRAPALLRSLLEVAARYIREEHMGDVERDLAIYDRVRHAQDLGSPYSMSRHGSPVTSALTGNVSFRQALYERLGALESHRGTGSAYLQHVDWSIYRDGPLAEDLHWALKQYQRSGGEMREDYARTAMYLASQVSGEKHLAALCAILKAAVIQARPDIAVIKAMTFDPLYAPVKRRQLRRRYKFSDPDAGLRGRWRSARSWARLKMMILRNMSAVRDGTAKRLLARLLLGDGIEAPREADLIQGHGKGLGAAVINGVQAHARKFQPTDHWPTVYDTDIMALAGFHYAWNANPSMPGVEPVRALRTAVYYSTDWPQWATELALANPDAWVEVAVPLLAREIASPRAHAHRHYSRFLSTVSHLDEELRATLAAPLFEAIGQVPIIDGPHVDALVRILKADPGVADRLPQFASCHAREAWYEGVTSRAAQWLPYWAERAEDGLIELLSWMASDASLIPVGLGIYVRLYGERSELTPPSLDLRYRFAALAYSHIRPQDDPPAKEGVHSVSSREDLQHLRGSVGELMAANFDAPERSALETLLETYVEPVSADWAHGWRNRYEQNAIKPACWSHAMIREAEESLATSPTTGDELFKRISEMIAELQQELASNEFDRRGLFQHSILESDFRAWLGHALDSRRRPWFSIVQEAETASANRTDLRIELRGAAAAVVVVEIKLVHRWRYDELLDKFGSQLVAQYLLEQRVRHGIYLLVDLGKKPRGTMADGSAPGSAELVAVINEANADMPAPGGAVAKAQLFQVSPSKRNIRREAKSKT